MSTISATAVKTLRDRTNQPMMDCKTALTEAEGDMEKAVEILRKRGKNVADKKGERETAEGRITSWIDAGAKVGAIIELRCESAPVAKCEPFVKLASGLVRQVALKAPATVGDLLEQPYVDEPGKTVKTHIADVIGLLRENMKVARFARLTGLVGNYDHHNGTVGVLLQVDGEKADTQLLRDVCMHVTATNPVAARRADVPENVVAKEREIAIAQAGTTGKSANIVEKIAEGKLNTWFAENVLEEQPFVKDPATKVGALLGKAGLKLVRFVRFKVGELT